MSLRRKLILLHTAFAVFAVGSAVATIYAVRLHVQDAANGFEQLVDQTRLVETLRHDGQMLVVQLHRILDGHAQADESYRARADAFFTRIREVAHFSTDSMNADTWVLIGELGEQMRRASDECLYLALEGGMGDAQTMLADQLEGNLVIALDRRLQTVSERLVGARTESVNQFVSVNTQLLGLATIVGALGVALVAVGAIVVRRWFILPITSLHGATLEFGSGNLDHRVRMASHDELGELGSALNTMASSLRASEIKYRLLFENLRDAVIICNPNGTVVECHDSDTKLLGIDPEDAIGHHLLDAWPLWRVSTWDWQLLVDRVVGEGARVSAVDVEFPIEQRRTKVIDVIAYSVNYGGGHYAAIVLRDVTERKRLQRMVSQSETMEASLNLARGVAHDFKNLLNSAVTTLSLISQMPKAEKTSARAQTALAACRQAASLSRRLLNFASSDQGNPEVFCLSETVDTILSSLDEVFVEDLTIETKCDRPVLIHMDRDQLTQVILNLVRNAREAMPEGGTLTVAAQTRMAADPLAHTAPASHAVLTVTDCGSGMTEETRERLFEPFYSTKPRTGQGARGMGLAAVYAAVRNAGGFIQLESQIDQGTTFQVYLPSGEGLPTKVLSGTSTRSES